MTSICFFFFLIYVYPSISNTFWSTKRLYNPKSAHSWKVWPSYKWHWFVFLKVYIYPSQNQSPTENLLPSLRTKILILITRWDGMWLFTFCSYRTCKCKQITKLKTQNHTTKKHPLYNLRRKLYLKHSKPKQTKKKTS